ncbi:LOW QUALITY PROTEIN: Protein CBG08369 [Caenorhabditis briggsae]|uniref:Protein CBG08369 n=1 Tax=Caenorhabditis briggsae TaxID=6238 RepID=A8X6E5_CAEBR|nr:LOW QUALITY PROTEIN: Protein CBG08369 [Caenorhabditis briggsae]CAP28206.1 Protein CBG08369 [Caenorhabditis briggsae]
MNLDVPSGRRKTIKFRTRNFSLEDERYWIQPSRCTSVDMSSREIINKLNEMEQEVYVSNKMRKLFLEQHEPVIAEAFDKIQNTFDDECTALLDQCFHTSERDSRAVLDTNYHLFIHTDGCPSSEENMEVMALASAAKAKNFLSHPACQREIDFRWQPGFKLGQMAFCLFFFFPPLFFLRGRQRIKKREIKTMMVKMDHSGQMTSITYSNFMIRVYNFYTSPNAKYVIHTLFRLIYVIFYAYVLMTMTRKTMVMNELDEFLDEMAIIVWQCAYLTEMAVLVYQRGFYNWAERNTADLYRNYLVAMTMIAWSLAVIAPPTWPIRAFAIISADLFFYFSFVFATLRLMKIANVDAFFGSIVLMIKKMIPIMVKFMFVFMVFWFTYAVCHISLAGHLKSTPNITDVVWPWLIFSSGAFEIFGEADEEDKLDKYDTSIPLLLHVLAKKYEDIDKVSHIYWKYKLYSRLIEYEEKLWIPAPLSLVFYILKSVFFFLSKIPIIGIVANVFLKVLHCFEGNNYAQDRRKNRKYEAVMNGLITNANRWTGPTDEEKKAVELVRDQMKIMGIECNRTDDTFKFAIAKPSNYHFTCPKHDGFHNPKINISHSLMCPTYCQVCKKVFICSGEPSFSGIRYMEDGRKKDQISFHYGTMIRYVDLEINWFILACYIFLFTLFTNIIAFVFTD